MYDIYFDLNNMHRAVEESDEPDEQFWHIGEGFDFEFVDEYIPKEELDDYPVIVKRYGCTCAKCGEFYPHAEAKDNFKCWSCRNF